MKKILVTYASKYGSTEGVAEAIGKIFRQQGVEVDVLPAKDVKDVLPYAAAVIGSAVYMGKWMPDAMDLIKKNKETLRKIPVAYFEVCMTMKEDTEKSRAAAGSYADPAKTLVTPVSTGLFAGVINYSRMSLLDRTITKTMKAAEGDFRKWDAIGSWAEQTYPLLLPPGKPGQ